MYISSLFSMKSSDLHWRIVFFYYIYTLSTDFICEILVISRAALFHWNKWFKETGNIKWNFYEKTDSNCLLEVKKFILEYVTYHLCFYLDKLKERFNLYYISILTIFCILHFDFQLSCKKIESKVRKTLSEEIKYFIL